MYKQEKYEDAARSFNKLAENETDPLKLGELYHNMGNSFLKANQLDASIEAYKQALRNNPSDDETRHNLAYAQKMKQEQEQQDQQDQDQQDQEEPDLDGELEANPNEAQPGEESPGQQAREQEVNPETGYSPSEARQLLRALADETEVRPLLERSRDENYKNW